MSIAKPPLRLAIASQQPTRKISTLHRCAFRPRRPPAVACLVSPSSSSFNGAISLTASVGSPPPEPSPIWKLEARLVFALNAVALAAAIASSWLFFSVIPSLLALKRAAESTEKVLDRNREELPAAMAAMRLSGAEISDLAMELGELGQNFSLPNFKTSSIRGTNSYFLPLLLIIAGKRSASGSKSPLDSFARSLYFNFILD